MSEGQPNCLASVDVLVLAGGYGTRLRGSIGETPKVLAPVAGRPFLAHLLAWLRRFGARRVVMSLGYKAEAVQEFLDSHPVPGLDVASRVEPEPLGTAGAIRYARPLLHSDPVLILNGDSFADADLCALLERQSASQALATVLCVAHENADRYGRVTVDRQGRIAGFVEKAADGAGPGVINAGVYAVSARLLDQVAAGSARSWEREVLGAAPAGTLAAALGRYTFIDIGTPESLAEAQGLFASLVN
jgi:NDP-sugar pyrophosphorylase family protein